MRVMSFIDRIAAWVLVSCFLIYMVSGLDIQLRFLSPRLSSLIHLVYLFAIAQTAFMIHTSYAIHMAFKRWKKWNALGKSLLGVYLAVNVYLFYIYAVVHI